MFPIPMRGNEYAHGYTLTAQNENGFPIPMRGNEFRRLGAERTGDSAAEFPIPMRGNEVVAQIVKGESMAFPIPMRGNEQGVFGDGSEGMEIQVSDPHEG